MKQWLRTLRERLEYELLLLLLRIARGPNQRLADRLGCLLGAVAFSGIRVRRATVLHNLSLAFPSLGHAERLRVAAQCYRLAGRSLIEMMRLSAMSREAILDLVSIEGREHLDLALQKGRGVVLVTGHFGNWELLGAALVAAGYPLSVLYKKLHNSWVDEELRRSREAVGLGTIAQSAALRGVPKVLRKNEIAGFLADQNARKEGIIVEFMGRPSSTHQGPALFALRCGAELMTVFIHRTASGRHIVRFDPPIETGSIQATEAGIAQLTQALNRRLEGAVREYPEQYFWFHRRWREG